jgi:hypothetical protein
VIDVLASEDPPLSLTKLAQQQKLGLGVLVLIAGTHSSVQRDTRHGGFSFGAILGNAPPSLE